ncbi:histidine kinase [Ideonella azotifigens]|uniref:Sensor histidine kinase n=1 Tax=Ideonella azotifigens TaxID=513160 RepID=A0ABN1JW81_9BURK|nr:sensor histidine kinase [Ideonella azotifigens]MCD2343176.1 histidine kinase [Ideonella azotifigens]
MHILVSRRSTRPCRSLHSHARSTRHAARHGKSIISRWLAGLVWTALALKLTSASALAIADYEHTVWGEKDGLAAAAGQFIQVPHGMLLMRTTVGRQVFDGVEFHSFDKAPAGGPFVDSADVLGQTSPTGAVYYIHPETFRLMRRWQGRTEAVEDKFGAGPYARFIFDQQGVGWYHQRGVLLRLEGLHLEALDDSWGIPKGTRAIHRPVVDAQGAVWFVNPVGLYRLPRGARVFERVDVRDCEQIAFAPDGSLWCTGAEGIAVIDMKDGRPVSQRRLTRAPHGIMLFDSRGGLWMHSLIGIEHAADWRRVLEPGGAAALRADAITPERGLSSLSVNDLHEDADGNIWLATATGIERFRLPRFTQAKFPRYVTSAELTPDADGGLWLGQWNSSLKYVANGNVKEMPQIKDVTSIRPGANHRIWVSTQNALWRKEAGADFTLVPTPDLSWRGQIHQIAEDDTGAVWLQAGDQLLRLQDGRISQPRGPVTPPADGRYILHADTQGQLWFAGKARRGPFVLRGGLFREIRSEPYHDTVTEAWVAFARGARVWIGGLNGVGVFEGDRFRPLQSKGNALKAITGIVETPQGDLWLSGLNKVFHIPAATLKAGLSGQAVMPKVYDHHDGLHGVADPGDAPRLVQDAAGLIWASTNEGRFWIDPGVKQAVPKPPVAQVWAVKSDGAITPAGAGVQLSANPGQIEFNYSAAALSIADRVRFRYRIEGIDSEWQEAGARRTAYYTQLPPGRHRFEVMASNEDGQWAEVPTSLAFEVLPAWYQTLWFRMLALSLVLGCLWLVYRLRVGVLRARERSRMREILAERERIARDLHDTLLQSMQGVILGFQAVATALPAQDNTRGSIESQLDHADQMLGEARDRVRDLRSTDADAVGLREAFESAAAQLAGTAQVEIVEAGRARALRPLTRDRIYLIGREALLNAVIHGKGSDIRVDLQFESRRFTLRVHDNGPGMAPEVLAAGARPGHYGLLGMRERAAQIGGSLTITSRPGGGTEVELRVPAAQAFEGTASNRPWRQILRIPREGRQPMRRQA